MELTKEFVNKNKDKRFTVTFADGRKLINIKLFVSTVDTIGFLTGRQKRRGYNFPIYDTIVDIKEVTKKKTVPTDIGNAKTILKKIHPNVWEDIQEDMKRIINGGEISMDFDYHYTGPLKFRNISKLLTLTEQKNLREAFEQKKRFSWERRTTCHLGRDFSISCEIGEDGKFRAWFSSEFMGCGNGDYWLLLNPTTAIYYEAD